MLKSVVICFWPSYSSRKRSILSFPCFWCLIFGPFTHLLSLSLMQGLTVIAFNNGQFNSKTLRELLSLGPTFVIMKFVESMNYLVWPDLFVLTLSYLYYVKEAQVMQVFFSPTNFLPQLLPNVVVFLMKVFWTLWWCMGHILLQGTWRLLAFSFASFGLALLLVSYLSFMCMYLLISLHSCLQCFPFALFGIKGNEG